MICELTPDEAGKGPPVEVRAMALPEDVDCRRVRRHDLDGRAVVQNPANEGAERPTPEPTRASNNGAVGEHLLG